MKNAFKIILTISSFLILWSCNINGDDIGDAPVGADTTKVPDTISNDTSAILDSNQVSSQVQIFVKPYEIAASGTQKAEVRTLVLDRNNSPMSDVSVQFKAVSGIVTAESLTDSLGEAFAVYQGIPENIIDTIHATLASDKTIQAKATIKLSGLTVTITPLMRDAVIKTKVPVEIKVTDGKGVPVPTMALSLEGMATKAGLTDGGGLFHTTLTADKKGQFSAIATAGGDTDTAYVEFWESVEQVTISKIDTVRKMRIFTSRTQLKADNSDKAIITVVLADEKNNPAVGDTVLFSSDLGLIEAIAIVDSNGRASVTLQSTPVNGTCEVTAEAKGRNLKVTTGLIFSGITLKLIPEQTELKIGEWAVVDALLNDGSNNPIGGDKVIFKLSGSSASFSNKKQELVANLGPDGRTSIQLSAKKAGTVIIQASALNTSDSIKLYYSNNTLLMSASRKSIKVGGMDSSKITATYVDGGNKPIVNATISFATNAGIISETRAKTNKKGQASTWLRSAHFTGEATVQATAPNGVSQFKIQFTAGVPKKVALSITADNIGVNGGQARLTATVQDVNGNMVTGHNVNFRILKGPGGGEFIVKPVSTCQNGVAISQINAGSQPSAYRGTEVEASVNGIADTSKLTISGTPHIITVARPEDDTVKIKKAGYLDLSTMDINIGAVVQDINGNYVADGTEVHFSAVVTGLAIARAIFVKWKGLDSPESIEAIYKLVYDEIPYEDINNNMKLDPGIDLDLDAFPNVSRRGEDFNGDGKFDYDRHIHDYFYDFNGNGVCDPDVGEDDTISIPNYPLVYADLNFDGKRNPSELIIDHNGDGVCDLPASGDYPFATWDIRDWIPVTKFRENDFAVVIEASATTKNGVAVTKLTYPRQFIRRLIVTVNAEANGIRDKNGERFILPKIEE